MATIPILHLRPNSQRLRERQVVDEYGLSGLEGRTADFTLDRNIGSKVTPPHCIFRVSFRGGAATTTIREGARILAECLREIADQCDKIAEPPS